MPSAETVVDSPAQPSSGSEPKPPASADPEKQLVGPSPLASTADGNKTADDAFLVEFKGSDDPYHPFNLPLWRRWTCVLLVSSASLCA
jgi:hypothetical protein